MSGSKAAGPLALDDLRAFLLRSVRGSRDLVTADLNRCCSCAATAGPNRLNCSGVTGDDHVDPQAAVETIIAKVNVLQGEARPVASRSMKVLAQ